MVREALYTADETTLYRSEWKRAFRIGPNRQVGVINPSCYSESAKSSESSEESALEKL